MPVVTLFRTIEWVYYFLIVPYGKEDRFEIMRRSQEKAERLGDVKLTEREGGGAAKP